MFKPIKINEIIDKNNSNSSSFVFNNLSSNMGITLGNYLRRFSLDYIGSYSIIAVEITDKNGFIKSEFSTIKGVREVTPFLILNLKKIILLIEEEEKKKDFFSLELEINNESEEEIEIKAENFIKKEKIKILNSDIYLTTISPKSYLKIKLYFRWNFGYHFAENQQNEVCNEDYFSDKEFENIIFIDTNYCPVLNSNFEVNEIITGLNEKKEEMRFSISSNGSITPKNILFEILNKSKNYFEEIIEEIKKNSKNL